MIAMGDFANTVDYGEISDNIVDEIHSSRYCKFVKFEIEYWDDYEQEYRTVYIWYRKCYCGNFTEYDGTRYKWRMIRKRRSGIEGLVVHGRSECRIYRHRRRDYNWKIVEKCHCSTRNSYWFG